MENKASRNDFASMSRDDLIAFAMAAAAEAREAKKEAEKAKKESEKLKAKVYKLQVKLAEALSLIDRKNQTILTANRKMFDTKSEHSKGEGRPSPVNEAEAISAAEGRKARAKPGRKPGGEWLAGLSRGQLEGMAAREEHIAPDEPLPEGAVPFGEDVCFKIVMRPASFEIVKVVRDKYLVGGRVLQARADADPFPHSPLTPSLAAGLLSAKFEMGVPLYRFQGTMAQAGLPVTEATLANWGVKAPEKLRPLRDLMAKELVEGSEGCIHCDETTLQVIDGEDGRKKSYVFVYSSSYYAHAVDLYDFSATRKTDRTRDLLKGFGGALVVDGYAGYDDIPNEKQMCWAHIRRKFWDIAKTPLGKGGEAERVVAMIDGVLEIERRWREESRTAGEIKAMRNSPDYLAQVNGIRDYITGLSPAKGSALEGARNYFVNAGEKAFTYLKDGRIPMTNNLAERVVKPFVIDRKNFLFCKTEAGAEAAAIAMTVIRTALRNGLAPSLYLKWVFENIESMEVRDLLPWSDCVPSECRLLKKQ